jgi:predicted XRE-type DNA-binding protein
MNIPLDRLYHHIDNLAERIYGDRVLIYRFWPHGSKKLKDLTPLKNHTWKEVTSLPPIYCHDQEALNFDLYEKPPTLNMKDPWTASLIKYNLYRWDNNIKKDLNIYDQYILLHSEQRSSQVEKYQQNSFIPAYYWSHAVIARDWFRYAEHVKFKKQKQKMFLIYNRAWSNTREYRLKFAELLIKVGLQDYCKTSINPIEPELGIHYNVYKFKNPVWQPKHVLENYFSPSKAHSSYSADFDIEDYEATDIEVVLETLFDDGRLHLTEKSLRPIACGQPFILAGTSGSLEYLRSYGFKTFGNVWDESYDLVEDPDERLMQIAELMKYISNWLPHQRERNMAQAQAIAEYNKKHFFSKEFFNFVINELKTNLTTAVEELELCDNYTGWINRWRKLLRYTEVTEFLNTNQDNYYPTTSQVDFLLESVQSKLDNTV